MFTADRALLETYDILEEIGRGSGGIIYKAYHKRLHKMVVLKKIIDPGRSVARNRQEVDILKDLNHSCLPQVLDFLETKDGVFTVMSFIPGRSFQEHLKQGRRFSKEDLLKWALQICSALNYLHTRRIPIIHGDIKPSNIMLRPDGNITLIDFNISFFFDENTVLGYTAGYTSPEQYWAASSRKRQENTKFVIDQKSDIYSVGATLYHLATGSRRTDFSTEIDLERLTEVVGPAFAGVIATATNLDPNQRYASAYDMYRALERVPEESAAVLKEERSGKRRIIGACLAAVLVICLVCGGFLLHNKHKWDEYKSCVRDSREQVSTGRVSEARASAEEAIDLFDDEPEGHYWKAFTYLENDDYGNCSAYIESIISQVSEEQSSIENYKSIADLYCLWGMSLMEQNRNDEAISKFEKAQTAYPELMGAEQYRDYSVALARAQRFNEAEEMLEKAKAAEPALEEHFAAFTAGEIEMAQDYQSDAVSSFRTCIDALKGAPDRSAEDEYMLRRAYFNVYHIQRGLQKWDDALETLQEARGVLNSASTPEIDRQTGYVYSEMGQFENAANAYQSAADSELAIAGDYASLASCWCHLKQPDLVDQNAEKYKQLTNNMDFTYYYYKAEAEALRLQAPGRGRDSGAFENWYYQAMNAPAQDTAVYQNQKRALEDEYRTIQQQKSMGRF